jgi:hypothetical protein
MQHFPNGKARQGTYPGMIYNAILDGYGLSYNSDMGSGNSLSARLVYTPLTYWNKGADTTGPFYTEPTFGGKKANTLNDLNSLMIEWNQANPGWARNFSVIYQGYQTGWNGYDGANVNPTTAVCSAVGAGVTARTGSAPLGTAVQGECNAATALSGAAFWQITAQNLTVMADAIADTGLDLGISYVTTETKNDESIYLYSPTLDAADGAGNGQLDIINGVATGTKGGTAKGTGMLVSAKYNFGGTYTGLEYVSNEKGNFVYGNAFEDLAKFYSTTGTGTHIYVGHKIKPELTGRIGIYNQTFKTSSYSFGPQTEYTNSPKNTVTYANLRLDF